VFQSAGIALGAVRLRVIDLHAPDQPLSSDDGRFVLAFNGEIYNHASLRQELTSRGHRFRSRCDTEVVLAAFQEWGTNCFGRLRGMFAIAVWDEAAQQLVLARDRLGIKPLYVYQSGSALCFGSELKAILAHPGVPRHLDWNALQTYLSLNYVPGHRTLIKNIHKLEPGHFLEYRNGKTRTECYWRLPYGEPSAMSLQEASERLDHLLDNSVKEHSASDVPLGVWLSGGLDSTTLVDYMARQSSAPVKTFSVAFESRCCDERQYFHDVVRHYGTQHEEIELRPNHEVISAIEEFPYYSDEPGADAGALPVWFLSKLSRKHVTVALSGEGSDEIFGGYLTYRANQYASFLRAIPVALRHRALQIIERLWPTSDNKISLEYKVKRLLRGSLLDADQAHVYWNGTFASNELEQVFSDHRQFATAGISLPSLYSRLGLHSGSKGLNRYLYFDQNYYLPDNLLGKVDRMSMAHSLEVRPPFLDHRLVEFAATLPENLKIRGSKQKFLLKHLMRNRLPKSVLTRSKTGFDIPAHRWLRNELRPLLLDTLSPANIQQSGIFHPELIGRLVRSHLDRSLNIGYHLWGLMTLYLWLKRWNIEAQSLPQIDSSPVRVFATSS
jgi:asparagine synthase (glutamine-hydrolysing)